LAVADLPSTAISSGAAEALAISDAVVATYQALRTAGDSLEVTDMAAATAAIARLMPDGVAFADAITTATSRSMADSLAVTDVPAKSAALQASESITVADAITRPYAAFRSMSDTISAADSATRAHLTAQQPSDSLEITDSLAAAKVFARQAGESITVSDQNVAGLGTARAVADAASIADAAGRALLLQRSMSESVAVGEGVAGSIMFARSATDSVSVADGPSRAYAGAVQLADAVSVADEMARPPMLAEQTVISDAVSIMLTVRLQDSVLVQDITERSPARTPGDSLQIGDQITSVTVSWSRNFDESLVLQDCTPFSCNQALNLGEEIALADTFSPPPRLADTVSASDSISMMKFTGMADALAAASVVDSTVRPVPEPPESGSPLSPLGVLIMSDVGLADPLPAQPVSGQYSMLDNPAELMDQLGLPILEIDSVSSADLPDMAVVLPTYHVSLSPSAEVPGDDALMTVRVAEVPAETQIIVPVDIASTPELAEHGDFPSMTFDFTPAVDASDFALMLSIMDSPPAGAQEPGAELTPLYLDIRWAGTFASADPGTAGFYSDPPDLTFAVTEDWADENDVERNNNGVPAITLNLLDESTGEWEEIDDIDFPSDAQDGRYTYVAHLEHFSVYAVAAAADEGGSGGGMPTGASLSVQLADSLAVTEEQKNMHLTGVEEPASPQFIVRLLDIVSVDSRPIAYWPLQAGENVSVLVTVTDIRPAGAFLPAATAAVLAEITNTGTETASLLLKFWHGGEPGQTISVDIGPGESRQVIAEVPFASSGEHVLNVEVRTTEGGLVAYQQMTFEVPWLAVYFTLLTALLGGLAAAAGAAMYLFARSKFT
jgi:hypothetical protein